MGKYTNASFRGTYGFTIIFGSNICLSYGLAVSKGNGTFKAIQFTNMGAMGGGQVMQADVEGTYSINPDGTGTAVVTMHNSDGTTEQAHYDYVVLQGKENSSGNRLALELQGMTREPGPGGAPGLSRFKLIP